MVFWFMKGGRFVLPFRAQACREFQTFDASIMARFMPSFIQPILRSSKKVLFPDGSLFVYHPTPSQGDVGAQTLPPLTRPQPDAQTKPVLLSDAQKEEMRQLRVTDPKVWTQRRLAEKFHCSKAYVAIVAPLTREHRQQLIEATRATLLKMGYQKKTRWLTRRAQHEQSR